MRRGMLLAIALTMVPMGAPGAQAVQVGGGGFSADVIAKVTPDRLPRRGYAPANLVMRGALSSAKAGQLTDVELRVDRGLRLAANTQGLETCAHAQARQVAPAQVRRRCGKALLGSGSLDMEFFGGSEIEFSLRQKVLLFNAGRRRILVYTFQPRVGTFTAGSALTFGKISQRSIALPLFRSGGVTKGFRLRIGRTWRDRGQKRSLLVGRCVGSFANRVTLRFGRAVLTGTASDPCRGR